MPYRAGTNLAGPDADRGDGAANRRLDPFGRFERRAISGGRLSISAKQARALAEIEAALARGANSRWNARRRTR